ncbi:MAG: hypothetical protein GX639_07600 [Fibrobacter sp.]|nr:hypothetical protein [Fibrobacter sp.]
MSYTCSATETYTVSDIEIVTRRVTSDFIMIASSTGAVSEDRARDWGNDIEILAKNGFLKTVDLTLLSGGIEIRAVRYDVNTKSGNLTMSRPGGVLWPKVANPELRIILFHTDLYDDAAKEKLKGKLRNNWSPTSVNTNHSTLKTYANRDYPSNGYGMQRKDFN